MSDEAVTTVSRRRKRRNLPKFVYRSRFFLLLIRDPKFRFVVAGALTVVLVFGAMLPRVWITCPKECPIVKRVSLFDLAAVPFLRHQAKAAAKRGDATLALMKWREALGNNPCDVEANRGYFDAVAAQINPSSRYWRDSGLRAQFFVATTHSNVEDIARVAGLYRAYGFYDEVFKRLQPDDPNLSPIAAANLLGALFETHQMERYGKLWARCGGSLQGDETSMLYHQAWLAGWGPSDQGRAAKQQLEEASTNASTHLRALRLLLEVDLNNADLAGYQAHLNRLAEKREERERDRYSGWLLLDICGKKSALAQEVSKYASVPATAEDGLTLVETLRRLKLYDRLAQFAHGDLKKFGENADPWRAAAEGLIEAEKWEDLRLFASEMRDQYDIYKKLAGYIPYLEGLAAYHRNQRPFVAEAFDEAAAKIPADPALAFLISSGIRRCGYVEQADNILKSICGKASQPGAFLKSLYRSAWEARRDDVALAIGEELLRLDPQDSEASAIYSSALLAGRKRPEESVKITAELLNRKPGDSTAMLNYASALAQSRQPDDAEKLLGALNQQGMGDREKAVAFMAQLDADLQKGRTQEAIAGLARIEQRLLFPSEQEWVSRQRYALRPKPVRRS